MKTLASFEFDETLDLNFHKDQQIHNHMKMAFEQIKSEYKKIDQALVSSHSQQASYYEQSLKNDLLHA
jgi:hypothetical protein